MGDLAALKTEMQSPDLANLSDAEATDALRAESVAGPDVLAPMYESELMGLLGPSSFAAVLGHLRFSEFKADVAAQNHGGVALWATVFALLTLVTADERDDVHDYCARTIPGPSRSRGAAVFGAEVTLADVRRARSL